MSHIMVTFVTKEEETKYWSLITKCAYSPSTPSPTNSVIQPGILATPYLIQNPTATSKPFIRNFAMIERQRCTNPDGSHEFCDGLTDTESALR